MKLNQLNWQPHSSPNVFLGDDEVHVWAVNLNQDDSVADDLFDSLAPNEKQKAKRFRFESDQKRFAVARGALREILGAYLDVSPGRIEFSHNAHGKPLLTEKNTGLRFNASRSQAQALIAVALKREIGVDVEFVEKDFAFFQTARSVFSPIEIAQLTALPRSLQTNAFFCGWTRKEAILKAVGSGFSDSPKSVTISIMPNETLFSVTTNQRRQRCEWSVIQLPIKSDYVAALAVQGKIQTVCYC